MAEERKTSGATAATTGAGAAAGPAGASPAAGGPLSLDVAGATVYELVAYSTRGEAEAVRLLMAYTGTSYRSEEVSFKKAAKYKKTLKLGRLPVLFDDRTCTEIGTPLAMLRHIARATGLLRAVQVVNVAAAACRAPVDSTPRCGSECTRCFCAPVPDACATLRACVRAYL